MRAGDRARPYPDTCAQRVLLLRGARRRQSGARTRSGVSLVEELRVGVDGRHHERQCDEDTARNGRRRSEGVACVGADELPLLPASPTAKLNFALPADAVQNSRKRGRTTEVVDLVADKEDDHHHHAVARPRASRGRACPCTKKRPPP